MSNINNNNNIKSKSICPICNKIVYQVERISFNGIEFHQNNCFKCYICKLKLNSK